MLTKNHSEYTCSNRVNVCLYSKLSFFPENLRSAVRNRIRMVVGSRIIFPNQKSLAKIWKQEHKSFVDQHVSWFDIQMNNVLIMKKHQTLNGLIQERKFLIETYWVLIFL